MTPRGPLRLAARVVIGLELVLAVGAFYGSFLGMGLLGDPSTPAIPLELLEHSPFDSFFIPSLLLLAVNGLTPLAVVALILVRHARAADATVVHGVFSAGWIVVQVAMLRAFSPPLHGTFFLVGVIIVALGVAMRRRDPSGATTG